MDIERILTEGIVFRGGKSSDGKKKEEKVKTKARRKLTLRVCMVQVLPR